jgi:predicted GIY-YIG superfamily endonuclease
MFNVYVLKCSYNKYYVGKTTLDPNTKFLQHLSSNNTCQFTNEYSPLAIIHTQQTINPLDEDSITKKYMMEFGIDNVRGGSYINSVLEDWQIKSLENEFLFASESTTKTKAQDKVVNETAIYLDSVDTLDKVNTKIKEMKKVYEQILILNEQIKLTSEFNLDICKDIQEDLIRKEKFEQLDKEINDQQVIINKLPAHDASRKERQERQERQELQIKFNLLRNKQQLIYFPHGGGGHTYQYQSLIKHILDAIQYKYTKIFIKNTSDGESTEYKFKKYNTDESKTILDNLPNDIKLIELINYNLDRKNELKKLLIEYVSEDDVKNKLYKLYEKRIKLIQYLSQNDFI